MKNVVGLLQLSFISKRDMLVFTKIARRKIKMTEKMKLRMERMTTNVNACLMDTI